jgi:predicted alternative tryptophan synthase beta-subunit
MNLDKNFRKNLAADEVRELFQSELLKLSRPADELLLTDEQLCKTLHVSQRLTAQWRRKKQISYLKIGAKLYYKYSDVLAFAEEHKVEAISQKRKF